MIRKIKNLFLQKKYSIFELLKRLSTGTLFSIVFWAVFLSLPDIAFSTLLIAIMLYILFIEWPSFISPKNLIFWLFTPLYPILPFIFMIIMMHNPSYQDLLLIMYIMVFSYDTGAFVVGKILGRHKLCPNISPKKTWEGVVGGIILATFSLELTLLGFNLDIPWYSSIILGTATSIISAIGDLFESWLKRRVRLKDSGRILPGHGGFLDRFDGILFTAIFFFIFKDYLVSFLKF